ncbi:response regulator [Shimia sp. R11_0]|uniref:Transcriptional regulatory protein TcrA n=1 Tax=Shimia marina TaxID=321267 RepID=A0A0P1FGP5_9RHOB|nr:MULTISPECIES: response regulator [Shimia]MBO9479001.1 response regulator [Shimia sp. R11_0]CUH53174.1 Transcriptional regulatory protein TcrA [Shimia marina]SFD83050.1 DNA-binding response regulator, OmpR family, contains REC and winged-helix (wHTH) domain [Shimia marina]
MKILAVDDDESIRELLTEAVSAKTTHQIVTVPSGPEAIRAIAKAKIPFDCFLLDIQMPVMDGITLARKIRKTRGHANTPILMLTAMSQKKYIDAAFAAGATDYVTKPFDFLELFSRISVASRLVSEHQRLAVKASEMASLKRDLLHSTSHSLEEPIEITGVTQVLGYVAFENHLINLTRGDLMRNAAFAVKINTIETAYKTLPAIGFRQLLTDISSEMMSVIAENSVVATYRGDGLFLCVIPRAAAFSQSRIEVELNKRLTYVPSTQMDGLQSSVNVGERFSMLSLTRCGAIGALQKAALSAEARANDHTKGIVNLRKSVRLHPGTGFQTEMERRAYEHLLQDALRDETHQRPAIAAFS